MRKRIKTDADNVCNDLCHKMFDIYYERTGIRLNYNDVTKYNFEGLASRKVIDDLYAMFEDREVWNRLEPLPNSQEYLKRLCDEFDVHIVTATHHDNLEWKVRWFKKYFPFIPAENIDRVHSKHWMVTDYAIDDYQENLKQDGAHRILIDAPWNRSERDDVWDFHRVKDLKEAYEVICRIEEEERSGDIV